MRVSPDEAAKILQQAIQAGQLTVVGENGVRFTDSTPSEIRLLVQNYADRADSSTFVVEREVIP